MYHRRNNRNILKYVYLGIINPVGCFPVFLLPFFNCHKGEGYNKRTPPHICFTIIFLKILVILIENFISQSILCLFEKMLIKWSNKGSYLYYRWLEFEMTSGWHFSKNFFLSWLYCRLCLLIKKLTRHFLILSPNLVPYVFELLVLQGE